MIDAADDMRQYFSVSVALPETIVYRPGDWHDFGKGDQEIKNKIY